MLLMPQRIIKWVNSPRHVLRAAPCYWARRLVLSHTSPCVSIAAVSSPSSSMANLFSTTPCAPYRTNHTHPSHRMYSVRAKRSQSLKCGSSRSCFFTNGSLISNCTNLGRLNNILNSVPANCRCCWEWCEPWWTSTIVQWMITSPIQRQTSSQQQRTWGNITSIIIYCSGGCNHHCSATIWCPSHRFEVAQCEASVVFRK